MRAPRSRVCRLFLLTSFAGPQRGSLGGQCCHPQGGRRRPLPCPEMAVLANALHLLMAGINMRAYFLHVPGKANPADIPSRVPFVPHHGSFRLDPRLLKEAGDIKPSRA
jgi:hypothetical protein